VSPAAIGTLFVLGTIVVAAAGLPALRQAFPQTSQPTEVASLPETVNAPSAAIAPTRAAETRKVVPPVTPAAVAAIKTDGRAAVVAIKTAPDAVAGKATLDANVPTKELVTKPLGVTSESVVTSRIEKSEPATVTGCLEAGETGFRLKDTSGIDALKSRSWKSAFLKKRSSTIEMVDAANTLQLRSHVGQRVSATGTLVNRTMRADTLQSLSHSCR
jgi:hypothetical protein